MELLLFSHFDEPYLAFEDFRESSTIVSCKIIDLILLNEIKIKNLKMMGVNFRMNPQKNNIPIIESYFKEKSAEYNLFYYPKFFSDFPNEIIIEWLTTIISVFEYVIIFQPKNFVTNNDLIKIYDRSSMLDIKILEEYCDFFLIWDDMQAILKIHNLEII